MLDTVVQAPARMGDRAPAQLVLEELFRRQDKAVPRTRLARILGRSPLLAESSSWYAGARGERAVADQLTSLPTGWAVFHSLPVGDGHGDIDHVVVGPTGVYTINTKHHSGKRIWVAGRTVMVDGHRVPYVPNAEAEARYVAAVLQRAGLPLPSISPLLVFVDPQSIEIRRSPALVDILSARRLVRRLVRRPAVLSRGTVEQISRVFDDPRSWRPMPAAVDQEERFAMLSAEVSTARRRRLGWASGGAVAATGVAAFLLPQVATLVTAVVGR